MRECVAMSVRIYLSSAVMLACLATVPAFAEDPDWPSIPASALANAYDDFPTATAAPLRPAVPANAIDWNGFYLGGDFSYSNINGDFSASTQAPIAYSLRELTLESAFSPSSWPVLGSASHTASGGGGFVGYNFVYAMPNSKVVFGVEANYDQSSLSLIAPNSPLSRLTPAAGGNTYLVNITGSGQVSNLDFGTLRARAGWAFGNFLPYAFVGAALGRADVNVTETTSGQQNPPAVGACSGASVPPCVPYSFSGTAGKNGEFLYGLTFGAGLDVALTHNIFLRAEYEYVQFQPVASIDMKIDTVRVGAGFKF
jgi:outer membrane immunogenic protein